MQTFFIALRTTVVTLVLTGFIYPLFITGAAQLVFPARANGSLLQDDRGRTVGSEWIGQGFSGPGYFQPRPSAAGTGYDPLASSGSNYGPTSKKLKARIAGDLVTLRQANPDAEGPVPAELVTASGSGLDPNVSPEAALWQLPRVARARGESVDRLRMLVESQVEGRDLGILGEPRVNILLLNLALDRQLGRPAAPAK